MKLVLFRRFAVPAVSFLVSVAFTVSDFKNIWVAIGLWVLAGVWLIFIVLTWKPIRNNETRTGLRMRGGKGTFKDTRIQGQDVAIDVNETELNMEDTDIK